jgi:cytoskeletal protein CcmA (bactofilin family)
MFNSKKGIDDKVSNKLTTLSCQSLIKGDCSIDGDMRIDGIVEGNIQCTGKIVIGPEGRIHGNFLVHMPVYMELSSVMLI